MDGTNQQRVTIIFSTNHRNTSIAQLVIFYHISHGIGPSISVKLIFMFTENYKVGNYNFKLDGYEDVRDLRQQCVSITYCLVVSKDVLLAYQKPNQLIPHLDIQLKKKRY